MEVVRASYSPEPIVTELKSVVDAKSWMSEQVPSLHDHLKAHQFKFECNEVGECRLFFKEWSTDKMWLPPTGLAILPSQNLVPVSDPQIIQPNFDADDLKKLESMLQKINAYLDKAGASKWWKTWLEKAWNQVGPSDTQPLHGNCTYKKHAF